MFYQAIVRLVDYHLYMVIKLIACLSVCKGMTATALNYDL